MSNAPALELQFNAAWPAPSWRDSHVVLAVSGGADSVAMLRAAVSLKNHTGGSGGLFVAHLNHGLRGPEADADEAWLRDLCQRLDVPLHSSKLDVAQFAARKGDGLEAAARAARYGFLQQVAERLGARFVALAHTADDQAETVLHRILRGTGLAGLAGMAAVRPLSPSVTLVRPLLAVRRRELLDYLASLNQDYRIDKSNANLQWTRNRLRHELLPMLREHYNSAVESALLRLATQASETQQLIAEMAAASVAECVTLEYGAHLGAGEFRDATCIRLACPCLSRQPPIVVREVCKLAWSQARWPQQAMGHEQWQQLAVLVIGSADAPAINLPGNVQARRDAELLILERLGLA
jgi:tRNA(Ile)-lysidine synthase